MAAPIVALDGATLDAVIEELEALRLRKYEAAQQYDIDRTGQAAYDAFAHSEAVAAHGAILDALAVTYRMALGLALGEQGYSGYDAGQIIGYSVMADCDQHMPLLRKFAQTFATETTT